MFSDKPTTGTPPKNAMAKRGISKFGCIKFNSSQSGCLDFKTGDSTFPGHLTPDGAGSSAFVGYVTVPARLSLGRWAIP